MVINSMHEHSLILYKNQEPVEVILSQHAEYKLVRGRHTCKIIMETFQYIPVINTLKA